MKSTFCRANVALSFSICLALLPVIGHSDAVRSGPVEADLVSEQGAVQAGTPFWVALTLRMEPQWHVYWKNPGDSGLPVALEWNLPPGFTAEPLLWPVPERFETDGLVTYGYTGEVNLLASVTPPPGRLSRDRMILAARVSWLACRVECIPGSAELTLAVTTRPTASPPDATARELFRSARARLPSIDPTVAFSAEADARRVVLRAPGFELAAGATVAFFPALGGTIRDSAPQALGRSAGAFTLALDRPLQAAALSRLRGVLAVSGDGPLRGMEVDAPVLVLPPQGLLPRAGSFALALVLAFAGGVLLNLMPCVLPVLSLKMLSLVRQPGASRGTGLRHGAAYSAGVLVSFWIIVAVLAGVRASGEQVGWGFQFQEPTVVTLMAVLFFLVGLNLFGVFEIGTWVARLGARFSGGGGAFASGLFAAAVATPCTAPFMGSALGYALSRPLPVAFGVFTALALGMSAPYLLLSIFPVVISRLPKQGPWMETLRQAMGFPMMGAVVWMLFVLSALEGSAAVFTALGSLLTVGLASWIWGRWGALSRPRRSRAAAGAFALLLLVAGPALAISSFRLFPAPALSVAPPGSSTWEPWSQERVDDLRRQGRAVFIDFTAKWCLSCQVNERVALSSPAVRARFESLEIATLMADWTDKSDAITRAIAAFGRAGVPLYVFYGKDGEEPVLLPELLTPGIVLRALDAAP
jgi:thiol:disulfide interchange protein DsbD